MEKVSKKHIKDVWALKVFIVRSQEQVIVNNLAAVYFWWCWKMLADTQELMLSLSNW